MQSGTRVTRRWAALGLAVAAMSFFAGTTSAAPVFTDGFNNGNPANSDTINGFWTAHTQNSQSSITEPNSGTNAGKLVIVSGTSDNTAQSYNYLQSTPQSNLDFFDQTLTFSTDLSMTDGAGVDASSGRARLMLTNGTGTFGQNNDALYIEISGDNHVRIGRELNGQASYSLIGGSGGTTIPGKITHVSFTVTATTYSAAINYVGDGGTPYVISPHTHLLTKATWGSGNGEVALTLTGQRPGDSVANSTTTAVYDNLSVSPVPEPGSLTLLGLGGLMMFKRKRR